MGDNVPLTKPPGNEDKPPQMTLSQPEFESDNIWRVCRIKSFLSLFKLTRR